MGLEVTVTVVRVRAMSNISMWVRDIKGLGICNNSEDLVHTCYSLRCGNGLCNITRAS